MIRFGPAGNSDSFYEQGYKSSVQMPGWLNAMGLNAYEYQCGKGIKLGEKAAREIGKEASAHDIQLSLHAPYYINMSSVDPEKRENSIRYILESLQAAKWLGAKRVVIHTGSCSNVSREWALQTAIEVLKRAIALADESGFGDITLCPEVLGKINQLGTLDEIICMCKIDDRLLPTIDFGHLHARGQGSLKTVGDFEKVLETLENGIGNEKMRKMHVHFSRVEYTKAGEKKHWTMDDIQYGPEFSLLAEALVKKGAEPVIICESRGHMAEDALKLKQIYNEVLKGF